MFKKQLLLTLFTANLSYASNIHIENTKIVRVISFNQFGEGDVVLKIANPIEACIDGYWLTKNDAGFNANLSIILSAYQAKNNIAISGFSTQLWPGSSGKYCKLYRVDLN